MYEIPPTDLPDVGYVLARRTNQRMYARGDGLSSKVFIESVTLKLAYSMNEWNDIDYYHRYG